VACTPSTWPAFPAWPNPNVKEASDLDGPLVEVGSRFRVVVSVAGRGKELIYEVVECERPDRVRLVPQTSMFSNDDLIEVEEAGTGVLVTYTADLRPLREPARSR